MIHQNTKTMHPFVERFSGFFQARKKIELLRISIGIIYLWFGSLKFFSGLSPAEDFATETVQMLTLHLIPGGVCFVLLAVGETVIGAMLILNLLPRFTILLALFHMLCTFTPLFLLPELSFNQTPFSVTLIGQYILKNLVIVSALMVLYPLKQNGNIKSK